MVVEGKPYVCDINELSQVEREEAEVSAVNHSILEEKVSEPSSRQKVAAIKTIRGNRGSPEVQSRSTRLL